MLKRTLSILTALALLLSAMSLTLISGFAAEPGYTIDDFDSYADDDALHAAWKGSTDKTSLNSEQAESGKSMKVAFAGWTDFKMGEENNKANFEMPADANGITMWIYASDDISSASGLQFRVVPSDWQTKNFPLSLNPGVNQVTIPFGENTDSLRTAGIMEFIIESSGTFTLYIDSIAFAKLEEEPDLYLIDGFDGYADDAALQVKWQDNSGGVTATLNTDAANAKSGKSMQMDGTESSWGGRYTRDNLTPQADAAGIGLWVKSPRAGATLRVEVQYNWDNDAKYAATVTLQEGVNEVKLPWASFDGQGDVATINQMQIDPSKDVLYIDNIHYLTPDEATAPAEPQEPTFPEDPSVLDDFEGYPDDLSLTWNKTWENNSGGTCEATLSLDAEAGNSSSGKALKIDTTDGGWMTITRNNVTVPVEATCMTFWAKASAPAGLTIEFRLNGNSYKYELGDPIAIGTEGAVYTVWFEDLAYQLGSGDDKGWYYGDKESCLVNAINFGREWYDAVTFWIDDIAFGTGEKPEDPDDPAALLAQEIADRLPAYDDLTLLDLETIEDLYAKYNELSSSKKQEVSNRQDLLDARELAEGWTQIMGDAREDVLAVAKAVAALSADADKATVNELYAAYSALTDEQKALIPGADALVAAYNAANGSGSGSGDGETTGSETEAGDTLPSNGESAGLPIAMLTLLVSAAALLVCAKKRLNG